MNQIDRNGNPVVKAESAPALDANGNVVKPDASQDDKDKNFAELRKKIEEKDAEIARMQAELKGKAGGENDFTLGDDTEDDTKGADKDALKKVFQRDMKEAILQWTRANKVTPAQWAEMKKKVRLQGDETLTEIKDAIQNAYKSLPEVQAEHEKGLIEQGKKEAMKNHFDDEIDIPGGGSGGSGQGGEGGTSRIPKATRDWGRKLGLTDKEIESVDPEADSNSYTILDPAYQK